MASLFGEEYFFHYIFYFLPKFHTFVKIIKKNNNYGKIQKNTPQALG